MTWLEQFINAIKMYAKATCIPVVVIQNDGSILHIQGMEEQICKVCNHMSTIPLSGRSCRMTFLYGSYQAMRFGGRYIYYCQLGLTHFAVPVLRDNQLYVSVIGGPIVMEGMEGYLQEDILAHFSLETGVEENLLKSTSTLPVVKPDRVHALAELLFMTVFAHAGSDQQKFVESNFIQKELTDNILNIRDTKNSGHYSIEKENELLAAIAAKDTPKAKQLLNEILADILLFSGYSLPGISRKVVELIVLLSRASIRGGAEPQMVLQATDGYLKEIEQLTNLEDLTYWLSKVMHNFSGFVFDYADVKHADVLFKAIEYIKNNYMKKITLEEVARKIYLSPSYFSKIFKLETKLNFNAYLNQIRIEKSKQLLQDREVSLADVAFLIGYEDPSYFTKVFKKIEGVTPLHYRQNLWS